VISGTVAITFEGVPSSDSVLNGKFREIYAGADRARHEADLGDHGMIERGITEELVWEIDPVMGAKVYTGVQARNLRRHFALLRGASPSEIYQQITRTGTQKLDGREHVLMRMTTAEGRTDTWYVDVETGCVSRIEIKLPTTEGMQAVWGMDEEMETQLTFADWRRVDGVLHPYRRASKIGPTTFTFICTEIQTGAQVELAKFTPPEAVEKLKRKPASKPAETESKSTYQIVDLELQRVATIRVKCKPQEITATLAVLFPEIMAHLNATGAKMMGVPFSRYHGFGEKEIDLEAGLPVAKPITEKGRVKNGELPAGKAVMAWHIGPYEKLGDAHAALKKHVDTSKLKSRGGPWEVYWTDPGMVPDSSKWRTQLFMPVE
jgi:effector-binding domain-containing protein